MQGARRPRGASRRCALQGQCQKNIGVRERSLSQTPVGRRVPFCIGFGLRATKRCAAAPPGGACARCRLRSAVCDLRSAVCGARPCDPWAPRPAHGSLGLVSGRGQQRLHRRGLVPYSWRDPAGGRAPRRECRPCLAACRLLSLG